MAYGADRLRPGAGGAHASAGATAQLRAPRGDVPPWPQVRCNRDSSGQLMPFARLSQEDPVALLRILCTQHIKPTRKFCIDHSYGEEEITLLEEELLPAIKPFARHLDVDPLHLSERLGPHLRIQHRAIGRWADGRCLRGGELWPGLRSSPCTPPSVASACTTSICTTRCCPFTARAWLCGGISGK